MQPRPYQHECLAAIDTYLAEKEGNPCVVLPTGAGKTPTMAWKIQHYLTHWPTTRVLVLAHVRELLEQGVEKMRAIWPTAPIGVYSAGLKSRDTGYSITYASIQSIWKKAAKFKPFDLIFVDEAHRIPLDGETTYRTFLKEAKEWARLHQVPQRVIGWTATPFRLDGGHICGPGHILNDICYEANVGDLIQQGFLCKLTSKAGLRIADVSGVHIKKGDYVTSELMAVVGTDEMVKGAVSETLTRAANRKAVIFFCVNVEHAYLVSRELAASGFIAPVVSAKTPDDERARIISDFTSGKLRGLCNVNVLSEGFDAQRIDCVVLLRPTASAGLFYQQVGRGLRVHPNKQECLVLDFSGNTERHGPIDAIEISTSEGRDKETPGEVPAKTCPECREIVAAGVLVCPACNHEFPPRNPEHDTTPSAAAILSTESETFTVKDVDVRKHQKDGGQPSIRVIYWDGRRECSEFICLEHDGYAKTKATNWWRNRFGDPVPATVDEAVSDLYLAARIRDLTESLTVRRQGKFLNVLSASLRHPKNVRYA
jgi:DNA repair protein RadD